jgi:hypothetical protein
MVKENPITGGTEELVKYSRLVLTVFSTVTDEYVVFFFVHDPSQRFLKLSLTNLGNIHLKQTILHFQNVKYPTISPPQNNPYCIPVLKLAYGK